MVKKLIKRIAENYTIPYFTITPTFSICPVHGYIPGSHKYCPHEHTEKELGQFGIEVPAKDADYNNRMAI